MWSLDHSPEHQRDLHSRVRLRVAPGNKVVTLRKHLVVLILCQALCWDGCSGQQFFSGTLGSSGIVNLGNSGGAVSGSDEWDGASGAFRSGSYGHGYTCVNIPANFTLCKNMDYTKMMVPNLLGHDSLQEAEYHAKSWIPLLRLQCHPETQLFLCSLFSPICLDRPIYPCRSLCQVVQASCEPRMLPYNYPWPSMLKCEQFPEDHDLCIRPGAANVEQKLARAENRFCCTPDFCTISQGHTRGRLPGSAVNSESNNVSHGGPTVEDSVTNGFYIHNHSADAADVEKRRRLNGLTHTAIISAPGEESECPACNQAHTCENIVDNFCRADFVFRAKFKEWRDQNSLEFRKGRWFKPRDGRGGRNVVQTFDLDTKDNCCVVQVRAGLPYIVMGVVKGTSRTITFLMQWSGKDKVLKNSVKTFRSMDCSNPLPMSVMAPGNDTSRRNSTTNSGAGGGRRRRRKQGGGGGGRRKGRQYSGGCRVLPIGKSQ